MREEVIEYLDALKIEAKKIFNGAKGSHAWDHTLRVSRICENMGSAERADMHVLRAAALLHDIGRSYQDASKGKICHAQKGAELAAPLIQQFSLSESRKTNIIHCIRSHRYRGDPKPETLEAKVLFDSDKLDAIGAVGVARAYLFAGEVGARLHNPGNNIENTESYTINDTGYREYRFKLCKLKDRMLTPTGKQWAEDRHAFMDVFFNRFISEYEGEK